KRPLSRLGVRRTPLENRWVRASSIIRRSKGSVSSVAPCNLKSCRGFSLRKDRVDKRATCLNCMDGRVQLPVVYWIKENYKVDFVDVITEAGMDGVLSGQEDIREVLRSITISVDVNKSSKLFVVGHYDCRGNPAEEEIHHQQI